MSFASPLVWVISSIVSLVLGATAAYTYLGPPKPLYQPNFCELDGGPPDGVYSAPDGTVSQPASTAGTTPGDAARIAADSIDLAPTGEIASDSPETRKYVSRASYYLRAKADGSPFVTDAFLNGLRLNQIEWAMVPHQVETDSEGDGVLGFYRLGLILLGSDAFKIAREYQPKKRGDILRVPFCPEADFKLAQHSKRAYVRFTMAEMCMDSVTDAPDPQPWMEAIKRLYPGTDAEYLRWEKYAKDRFEFLMKARNLDPANGNHKREFCLYIPGEKDRTPTCGSAKTALQALNLGKAFFADGKPDEARACFNDAINLAKTDPSGPEPGFQAQRALQSMASSCKWNRDSLHAINRDYEARSTDLLRVETLQQALRALNHYDGPIDDQLSPAIRAAIRKFQREQGDDETDILSPLQMTQLICSAAETEDLASQTTLGVMYILGAGVVQNIDSAQQWLTRAANRHYPDATYNLAMLYGTGIVLDSYRLCDVPRTPEQADRYLAEAAEARNYSVAPGTPPCKGQLMAQKLIGVFGPGSKYGALPPSDRWMLIERQAIDKIRSGPFGDRLQNIGKKCRQPLTPEP